METASVFEIDTASKNIVRVFDTNSAWTKVVHLSPEDKKLYASNWSGNNVTEIDLETGQVLRQIPTVATPRGIYVTRENILYVAGFKNGEIQKIDLETGRGEVIFRNGGAMRHIAADEEKEILYVSDMAHYSIWKVSMSNDTVEKFTQTEYNPNTIALSPDKRILFVSCRGLNAAGDNYYLPGPEWGSVLLFNTDTGQMLDAIVAGNQPTGLDVSPDGKTLVFSNFLDGSVELFKIPSFRELEQGGGGLAPYYKQYLGK